MRAPWNMDAAKAAQLSKAQWLQAHEAILLECGYLVCLDGHAEEPRDAYHPITPKNGVSTALPEFNQIQELYDYLKKQSMPLAVRQICQRASPNLYAAAYPVDALGLPTQPSLPEIDDIDNPEVIIQLQVPFVALALVLQQHVKVVHEELGFELDPAPDLQKRAKMVSTGRGPRRPKKKMPMEEQITVQAIPEVAEDIQMRTEPTKKPAATASWDLEQARRSIPVKDLLETRKKGNTNRKVTETQLKRHERRERATSGLKELVKQLIMPWLQNRGQFLRQQRQPRECEEAAHNERLGVKNADLTGLNCKENRILRRLEKSKDWVERSRWSDDLEKRIKNINELRHAIRANTGKVAELDQELITLKELQAKRERENRKASQSVRDLEAHLSRLRDMRAHVLQEYEGATNGDFDGNTSAPKPIAPSPLVAREVLKGESFTKMSKRRSENSHVTPAAIQDQ
ncbi:hypothetical protein PpBr36_00650 [Pyricularia pennisetigena]|uniref:hypothetical protein n=1 Tax=Pyricularia pennisetigena TaxID=1578925 RepID=UPI0011523E46|nr:hypothetical protein PpBr36_00650 [Pyricularia pennisetigena]TLS28502.1 hypothetical protein PpBr36_00650 [Pyricularia pennisetigena]